MRRDDRLDVRIVRRVIFALDRVGRDPVLAERCSDVILRRERVAGAERDARTSGLQREHQIRRLSRDVETGADAYATQRLFDFEPIVYLRQHRHIGRRPRNAGAARLGEFAIFDAADRSDRIQESHYFSYSCRKKARGLFATAPPTPGTWKASTHTSNGSPRTNRRPAAAARLHSSAPSERRSSLWSDASPRLPRTISSPAPTTFAQSCSTRAGATRTPTPGSLRRKHCPRARTMNARRGRDCLTRRSRLRQTRRSSPRPSRWTCCTWWTAC